MKRLLATLTLTALLLIPSLAHGKEKILPPFAVDLSQLQTVDIIAVSNVNQTQYLGYDWINTYCFGRFLGCAVSDQPATYDYSYGSIIFKVGDWFIYATCFGDANTNQIAFLYPCWQPGTRADIAPQKNMRTLIVTNPGEKSKRWRGHTYTIVSAYNPQAQQTWGNGTVDAWRIAIAAPQITEEMKLMSINDQLAWSAKLSSLNAAGLANAGNLEQVLAEMTANRMTRLSQLARKQ